MGCINAERLCIIGGVDIHPFLGLMCSIYRKTEDYWG